MRSIAIAGVMVLVGAARASASPAADVEKMFRLLADDAHGGDTPPPAPRFAMSDLDVQTTDDDLYGARDRLGDIDTETGRVAVATTADGAAAWVAVEQRVVGDCGGDGGHCGETIATRHVGAVFERAGGAWQPVVWDAATDVSSKRQRDELAYGKQLAEIPAKVDGADAAVTLFSSTIGDPKALAATVSARKDAVLLGSSQGETFIGAKAKAQLAKWNLAFKVHDGVRAGTTANGALAWVAANVDATPAGKPKAKATPYRALFVYLKSGDRWELVLAQFSFGES